MMHIEVKSGSRSVILNLIKLIFFMVYPYLKLHILFDGNGLTIWSGFPDITHIKKKMAVLGAMTYFLSESCPISNSS